MFFANPKFNDHLMSNVSFRWVWKKWSGPKQLEDKKTKSLMMLPYVRVMSQIELRME
jgi:cytochrome c peroxidase